MTTVVIDCSVAIKWFVREPDSMQARALLGPPMILTAPSFICIEIANALWKNECLGRMSPEEVDDTNERIAGYFNEIIPSEVLVVESSFLARSIRHPIYDCLYVVAARRLGAQLVTADKALLAKVAGTADADRVVDLAKWPVA